MSERKRTALEDKWAAEAEVLQPEPERTPDGPGDREVESLQSEVVRLKDQLQRSQADLVNFRRRTERERSERRDAERAAVLAELLPVVDDFERAVDADDANAEAYRKGVELILRSLQDNLARLGLTRLEPLGEAFDPNFHEAVERQETQEAPDGHVVAVYKPGYMLGERLVRPAMVAVAAAPVESQAPPAPDDES